MDKERMAAQELRDGADAEALLANPLLKAAFENTESQIFAQMRAAPYKDGDLHTRLVMALQMLGAIRRNIETTIETGQMAKLQIEGKGKLARLFG